MKSALLIGSTGLVGSHLLHLLLHSEEYSTISIFVRKPIQLVHPKLTVHIVDFDFLDIYKSLIVANDIFCCLGTTIKSAGSQNAFLKVDFEYPSVIARFAKENGADTFSLISSIAANKNSSLFYNKVKGKVEYSISEIGFEKVLIYRPSLLLGVRKEFRIGEKIGTLLSPLLNLFFVGSLKKYKPIRAETVAKSMYRNAISGQSGTIIFESDKIQITGE